MFGPVVEFNVGAWVSHTRDMHPLARSMYMDILWRLMSLGEDGRIPDIEAPDGMRIVVGITGCTPTEIREHWRDVSSRLDRDDEGWWYSKRARILTKRYEIISEVRRGRPKSATYRLEKEPTRPYIKTDYSCDADFQRFWSYTPGRAQQRKRHCWLRWRKNVAPFGQVLIERVIEKWAAYCETLDITDDYVLPETWLGGKCWELDIGVTD